MMQCLSPEDMAALIDGGLSAEQRRDWLQHIAECEKCLDEYLFLTALRQLDEQKGQQSEGAGDKDGVDLPAIGLAGLGAMVVPLFGSAAGHGFHEPKVAGHEKNSGHDERNVHGDDTKHHHEHSNTAHMSDAIHPAEKHLGPEASEEHSYDVDQHYSDTCAIRSQQLILRDYGVNVTQEELIKEAKEKGWYQHGTPLHDIGNLLESHGLGVNKVVNANEYNLFHELAMGHEVIVAVNSNELWHYGNLESLQYSLFGGTSDHALIVAGIDTRDEDNIKVIVKDPGTGQIAKEYPMEQFVDAWKGSHCFMVTTDRPAPASMAQMEHFNYHLGHIDTVGHQSYEEYQHHITGQLEPYVQHLPDDLFGHHHDPSDHHTPGPSDPHYPTLGPHDPGHHTPDAYTPGHHDQDHHSSPPDMNDPGTDGVPPV